MRLGCGRLLTEAQPRAIPSWIFLSERRKPPTPPPLGPGRPVVPPPSPAKIRGPRVRLTLPISPARNAYGPPLHPLPPMAAVGMPSPGSSPHRRRRRGRSAHAPRRRRHRKKRRWYATIFSFERPRSRSTSTERRGRSLSRAGATPRSSSPWLPSCRPLVFTHRLGVHPGRSSAFTSIHCCF